MVGTGQNRAIVSFVIPAFNEEDCIRESIRAIRMNAPRFPYQIIVVDNGSTDRTSAIVDTENAVLVRQSRGTIASARNRGVAVSQGRVLVFLDADVIVTNTWKNEIDNVISAILKSPLIVTGSRCDVADNENWISRYWFARMKYEKANYINSGHMITSRELFDSIGGFREELCTAEDYDFCMRAKKIGAEIVNNPKLYVIHTGYPTTLKGFIARERWHGYEDFRSLHNILQSKVALIAGVNVILIIAFLMLSILNGNVFYFLIYFIVLYILSVISTLFKFGFGNFGLLIGTSVIFFCYYIGRSLSFLDRLASIFGFKNIF